MRINKFIANNSKYSRRHVDELITAGKVFVNGEKTTELGKMIDPENDEVKIEGTLVADKVPKVYLLLNKPKGYVTTRQNEDAHSDRPTVMDLLPKEYQNLKPVGRLDMDTEGLLIMTNDGEYINKITHPRFEHEKTYYAEVRGELTDETKEKVEAGIIIEGRKTAPAKILIKKRNKTKTTLSITIHEGRNRQIRKMFGKAGHYVQYLMRIRSGNIVLGNLKQGQFRKLTLKEINAD